MTPHGARPIWVARSGAARSPRKSAERSAPVRRVETASIDAGAPRWTDVERRAFSKAAWRLVPFLTFGYLLNDMDRNNVGFAALAMKREIGLTTTQFGVGVAMALLLVLATI